LGSSKATLDRYFGDASHVSISRQSQILCLSCFAHCESLSSVSFEIDSELIGIESNAFLSSSEPKSITIPRHVQILCSGCFSHCEPLSSSSFERDSELKRIESKTFYSSFLKSITIRYRLQLLCLKFFRLQLTFVDLFSN
jgi:hypothetical protein